MDEYIDEIDYYRERTQKIEDLFHAHKHQQLQEEIETLSRENKELLEDLATLKEVNVQIKSEILDNKQKVEDLREVQSDIIEKL